MSLPAPAPKVDWHALIIGLILASSALTLFGLAALTLLFIAAPTTQDRGSLLMTLLLFSGGLFFSGLLLLPGTYLNGRKFFNLPDVQLPFPAINTAAFSTVLMALWVLSLALGQVASSTPALVILMPFLNIVAIGFPVALFLKMALQKLALPPARYAWSVFGITLSIGPLAGILAEGLVFIAIILLVGLYAGANRDLAQQFRQLAEAVQNTRDSDTLVAIAAPMLFSPAGLLTLLGLFSVAVPAIEETIKVAVLWLFADRISHPMHGFVLGVLSGAAFALAENLGFASTGANDWVATAVLRASSALPHMLNSGILGWALVAAWKKHSYARLGAAYLAVILIHGTWNAISLALWLNALLPYVQHSPAILATPIPFYCGWVVMIAGTLAGLVYSNWSLRRLGAPGLRYNEPLSSTNTGETRGDSESAD